ncbi:hypothetical protein PsorP6_018427 [Peronosclerospora sorghi]|nr:hypothetical protein PsorP6_018433 [Peronosclerospora sorghi]KAI9895528.1 hypothetical protein PsorP6_018427 [Peronosclerospora sorghi]
MTIYERDICLSRTTPRSGTTPMTKADLATESVLEDSAQNLEHKGSLSNLETYVSNACVMATNTSALPIADVAPASKRAENVRGMHYYYLRLTCTKHAVVGNYSLCGYTRRYRCKSG